MERQRQSKVKEPESSLATDTATAPTKTKIPKGAAAADATSSYTAEAKPMETIDLGNKRPEGITRGPDEDYMFVTEMLYGGIKAVNVVTGEIQQVVPSYGFLERGAYGVIYHEGALFVAGGGIPDGTPVMMYVYDAATGEEIASCSPDGDGYYLLNDVAILGDYAYVTDSFYNKLMKVDVAAALEGNCVVSSIETPAEYFLADPIESGPRANGTSIDIAWIKEFIHETSHHFSCNSFAGIIAYDKGLIVARTEPGGLYYLDLEDGDIITNELATPDIAPRNDGLAIAGDVLYSTENTLNSISAWRLVENMPLRPLGRLDVEDLDFPATLEIYNDKYLCTVDACLKSLPVTGAEGSTDFNKTFVMQCIDRTNAD